MISLNKLVDDTISEIDQLKKIIRKKNSIQVTSSDETSLVRATAFAWFNNRRPIISLEIGEELIGDIDEHYKHLLTSSEKATSRTKYISIITSLRKKLVTLRSHSISKTSNTDLTITPDIPPDFAPLIKNAKMIKILNARWLECTKCLSVNASLSATVMMGGLLEALLLAKFNSNPDKNKVFKTKTSPIDKKTKKKLQLKEWTLTNYLNVAHELGWISKSTKDIGSVLRDYRNYIHPFKELSHNITLEKDDVSMFWEITKSISKQIIKNSIT